MTNMPNEYLDLARERCSVKLDGYFHPEDFNYDFREWVSPYTKGAHSMSSIAIVLQDWSSKEKLSEGFNESVQKFGRDPSLKTNRYLAELVKRVFGLDLSQTYITNIFPFVKTGNISNRLPNSHVTRFANQFLKKELAIANPKLVLALGNEAQRGMDKIGIQCIGLPHPAARIGSVEKHHKIWQMKLK